MARKVNVAILMGGPSNEHEVSLGSGRNVFEHIARDLYDPIPVTIGKEGTWSIAPETLAKEMDVAFIALHGAYGEDGGVQHDLEVLRMPYTGSDAAASALAMNKLLSLRVMEDAGLTVPATIILHWSDWARNAKAVEDHVALRIGFPAVVKPNRGGSSIGTVIVHDAAGLSRTLAQLFAEDKDLIAQPLITGREVTCGVLDTGVPESAYALPPIEIVPRRASFFDYAEKYDDDGAEEIAPARLPDTWIVAIERVAKKVHHALGLRHLSRTDMILGTDGRLYVLETNTIPSLTKTSLLPKAAAAMGISFDKFIDRIVTAALM